MHHWKLPQLEDRPLTLALAHWKNNIRKPSFFPVLIRKNSFLPTNFATFLTTCKICYQIDYRSCCQTWIAKTHCCFASHFVDTRDLINSRLKSLSLFLLSIPQWWNFQPTCFITSPTHFFSFFKNILHFVICYLRVISCRVRTNDSIGIFSTNVHWI